MIFLVVVWIFLKIYWRHRSSDDRSNSLNVPLTVPNAVRFFNLHLLSPILGLCQVLLQRPSSFHICYWLANIVYRYGISSLVHPFFIRTSTILETKPFFVKKQNKSQKRTYPYFLVKKILLLNEAFSFYSFKISRIWGKRKLNLRTKKAFLKPLRTFRFLV